MWGRGRLEDDNEVLIKDDYVLLNFVIMKKIENVKHYDVKDVDVAAKEPNVFANLTYDKGFKIVLGTEGRSEKILTTLLNHLLKLKIVDLKFLQTEKLGLTEEDGESFFDVYCKDRFGRRFLVEMQMWNQPHFGKRSTLYASLAVLDQVRDARAHQKELGRKWDYDFDPIYVICFMNSKNTISEDPDDTRVDPYVSRYITRSIATGKDLGDEVNRIFVDLHRFRKTFVECANDVERWLFSIKYMHKLSDSPIGIDGTELEELYDEAKLAAWNPELRTKYERYMANKYDYEIGLQYEKELARKEGLEEGRAEGRAEGMAKAVSSMVTSGMDLLTVSRILAISEDECQKYIDLAGYHG